MVATIDNFPDEAKPIAKKRIVAFMVLIVFIMIIVSVLGRVWGNPWAMTAFILLAMAAIFLLFRVAFTLKELEKQDKS